MKLSNSVRDDILSRFMEDYIAMKKIPERVKTITEYIQGIVDKSIGEDILSVYDKYPAYFRVKRDSVFLLDILKQPYAKLYPSGNSNEITYFSGRFLNYDVLMAFLREKFDRTVTLRRLVFDMREAAILKGKVDCILSSIATSAQLRDEFPECYKYLSVEKKPAPNCESIESVRAMLQSNK